MILSRINLLRESKIGDDILQNRDIGGMGELKRKFFYLFVKVVNVLKCIFEGCFFYLIY